MSEQRRPYISRRPRTRLIGGQTGTAHQASIILLLINNSIINWFPLVAPVTITATPDVTFIASALLAQQPTESSPCAAAARDMTSRKIQLLSLQESHQRRVKTCWSSEPASDTPYFWQHSSPSPMAACASMHNKIWKVEELPKSQQSAC